MSSLSDWVSDHFAGLHQETDDIGRRTVQLRAEIERSRGTLDNNGSLGNRCVFRRVARRIHQLEFLLLRRRRPLRRAAAAHRDRHGHQDRHQATRTTAVPSGCAGARHRIARPTRATPPASAHETDHPDGHQDPNRSGETARQGWRNRFPVADRAVEVAIGLPESDVGGRFDGSTATFFDLLDDLLDDLFRRRGRRQPSSAGRFGRAALPLDEITRGAAAGCLAQTLAGEARLGHPRLLAAGSEASVPPSPRKQLDRGIIRLRAALAVPSWPAFFVLFLAAFLAASWPPSWRLPSRLLRRLRLFWLFVANQTLALGLAPNPVRLRADDARGMALDLDPKDSARPSVSALVIPSSRASS